MVRTIQTVFDAHRSRSTTRWNDTFGLLSFFLWSLPIIISALVILELIFFPKLLCCWYLTSAFQLEMGRNYRIQSWKASRLDKSQVKTRGNDNRKPTPNFTDFKTAVDTSGKSDLLLKSKPAKQKISEATVLALRKVSSYSTFAGYLIWCVSSLSGVELYFFREDFFLSYLFF